MFKSITNSQNIFFGFVSSHLYKWCRCTNFISLKEPIPILRFVLSKSHEKMHFFRVFSKEDLNVLIRSVAPNLFCSADTKSSEMAYTLQTNHVNVYETISKSGGRIFSQSWNKHIPNWVCGIRDNVKKLVPNKERARSQLGTKYKGQPLSLLFPARNGRFHPD